MSCNKCSIKNGQTLFRNYTYDYFRDVNDTYINKTCPVNEECVEKHFEDYLVPDTYGCCRPCKKYQFCDEGSIARISSFAKANMCPDGYTCNGDPPADPVPCKIGTMCAYNNTMNCTDAVEKSFFSEILQGTYCDAATAELELCETGYYCPTPAQKILCPSDYFCMRKSKDYWLDCAGCDKGEEEFRNYSGTIIGIIFALVFIFAISAFMHFLGRYKIVQDFWARTLAKIKKPFTKKKPEFNAEEILLNEVKEYSFDEFDVGGKGYVTVDDVQKTLSLSPLEVERLQYLLSLNHDYSYAGMSREFFSKHFPIDMFKVSHINPTGDEVSQLFEKLDINQNGVLEANELYYTYLTLFLEESEIHDLVKLMGEKISKEDFIEQYPSVLSTIIAGKRRAEMDIVFRDLGLTVGNPKKGKTKVVVDNVTGIVEAKKMTALMGGSGAGKTSLLNALCGRAYYGVVTGEIYFNGRQGVFDDIKGRIGFVPQDDIVYAELTVMENFLFAGRFRLPEETTEERIRELAEEVVADLSLVRVKDSVVGDVTRRGVSGGEKKRVNIGVELMSHPVALFLDEPTSGLDSSSSLHVMTSLKILTQKQKMTICSVIHQPRKFIFEQFDNVILLAAGGKMVYIGPTQDIGKYFSGLGYTIPVEENIADFIIDVATGSRSSEEEGTVHNLFATPAERVHHLCEAWKSQEEGKVPTEIPVGDLPDKLTLPSKFYQTKLQIRRRLLVMKENKSVHTTNFACLLFGVLFPPVLYGVLEPVKEEGDEDYLLPYTVSYDRLYNSLIAPLHDYSYNINYTISALCHMYYAPYEVDDLIDNMVTYAKDGSDKLNAFGLLSGLVVSLLIALGASKLLTQKRLEFFRESASGYSVSAFFYAQSICYILESAFSVFVCSLFARALRRSMYSEWPFYLNYILLAYNAAGWGIFYSSWADPGNVATLVGFHMVLAVFLSGCLPVMEFEDIYDNEALNAFVSFVSPMRLFLEGITVSEEKCLKAQSGFTSKTLYLLDQTCFDMAYLGQNDPNVSLRTCDGWYWNFLPMFLVGSTLFFLSGILLHLSNRQMMMKCSVKEAFKLRSFRITFVITSLLFLGMFAVTVWSIVDERGKLDDELDSNRDLLCSIIPGPTEDCYENYDFIMTVISEDNTTKVKTMCDEYLNNTNTTNMLFDTNRDVVANYL